LPHYGAVRAPCSAMNSSEHTMTQISANMPHKLQLCERVRPHWQLSLATSDYVHPITLYDARLLHLGAIKLTKVRLLVPSSRDAASPHTDEANSPSHIMKSTQSWTRICGKHKPAMSVPSDAAIL